MKLKKIKGLLFLVFALALLSFLNINRITTPKEHTEIQDTPANDLLSYVQEIEGSWLSPYKDSSEAFPDNLWIKVREDWIEKDKVKIFISEYCKPGIAEYLLFELYENSLCYVAAIDGDCIYQPIYLDFIELKYDTVDGETVLYYESYEAERENQLIRMLRRIPPLNVNI